MNPKNMEHLFKRKLYSKLLEWKHEDDGRTAILVEGARRVGKSTLVETFARNEYDSYILVDFSKCSKDVKVLFDDISDMNLLFNRLQFEYGVELIERKSVIIFDEVQFAPKARQAIKHFVADHRYDYIETGSLISIRRNVKDILIPSEEIHITMRPMDYEEFLWATGKDIQIRLLDGHFNKKHSLGDAVNRKLMRDFRLYMLIGGMPQAVSEYLSTKNLVSVDRRKREIIQLYEEDFRKIDPTGTMSRLFHAIPAQLCKNAGRYKIGEVDKNKRAGEMRTMLNEMADSHVVSFSYHANDPNVGLSMSYDMDRFKMYVGDTGLFVTLAFWDKDCTENIIYQKLLNDKLSADMGYVYENAVAQMLLASGHHLCYYTFPTESGKHSYEVDFIISEENKISPIEVKSSGYRTHASIDAFCRKYSSRIKHKYLIYTKDFRKEGDMTLIPAYMTMFL